MNSKPKILLIEDEAINALLISNQLKRVGYEVCKLAATGDDAIQIFINEKPDFLLIDIGLAGGMDGVDTARKIAEIRQVPFAFLTGYASDTISRRVTDLTPVAYLTKPIQFGQTDNLIQSVLKNAE